MILMILMILMMMMMMMMMMVVVVVVVVVVGVGIGVGVGVGVGGGDGGGGSGDGDGSAGTGTDAGIRHVSSRAHIWKKQRQKRVITSQCEKTLKLRCEACVVESSKKVMKEDMLKQQLDFSTD